jgi:hypothetical protein
MPNMQIEQEDARLDGVSAAHSDPSVSGQSAQVPAGSVLGSVSGPRDEDVQRPRGTDMSCNQNCNQGRA